MPATYSVVSFYPVGLVSSRSNPAFQYHDIDKIDFYDGLTVLRRISGDRGAETVVVASVPSNYWMETNLAGPRGASWSEVAESLMAEAMERGEVIAAGTREDGAIRYARVGA